MENGMCPDLRTAFRMYFVFGVGEIREKSVQIFTSGLMRIAQFGLDVFHWYMRYASGNWQTTKTG